MRGLGRIIYLRASWEVLLSRLQSSIDRPLVDQEKNWHELKQLWQARLPHYLEADIVYTEDMSPKQVARKIVSLL